MEIDGWMLAAMVLPRCIVADEALQARFSLTRILCGPDLALASMFHMCLRTEARHPKYEGALSVVVVSTILTRPDALHMRKCL